MHLIDSLLMNFLDSKGNPRCITNSKGRKRRPGSKDLTSILKNCDPVFVNFVSRCLEYVTTIRIIGENKYKSTMSRTLLT